MRLRTRIRALIAFSVTVNSFSTAIAMPVCAQIFTTTEYGDSDYPNLPDPTSVMPKSKSPLFQGTKVLKLQMRGDFARVHEANKGGNWHGEDRTDAKYWSALTLVDKKSPNILLKGQVRARGMSSATEGESEFPKLRVELTEENLVSSVFKGAKKFRMNTHVKTVPDPKKPFTEMGRLNDERSPYREATAYEIAQVMGLPSPLVRRARVEYIDTSDAKAPKTFVRSAILIETDGKVGERFGAEVDKVFPQDAERMSVRLAARFHLFNILIGNDDVGLKLKKEPALQREKYRPFFNTTVFKRPQGDIFPIAYDFDMASQVSGWRPVDLFRMTLPEFDVKDARLATRLNRLADLRSRLRGAEFKTALGDFASREHAIRLAILKAKVDPLGRKVAFEHLDLLKQATDLVLRFPLLMKKDVRFFAEPELKTDLLSAKLSGPGTLAPGTLVRVLEEKTDVVKIAIVDSRNYLADHKKYIGYVKKSDLMLGQELPEGLQGQMDERDMTYF